MYQKHCIIESHRELKKKFFPTYGWFSRTRSHIVKPKSSETRQVLQPNTKPLAEAAHDKSRSLHTYMYMYITHTLGCALCNNIMCMCTIIWYQLLITCSHKTWSWGRGDSNSSTHWYCQQQHYSDHTPPHHLLITLNTQQAHYTHPFIFFLKSTILVFMVGKV